MIAKFLIVFVCLSFFFFITFFLCLSEFFFLLFFICLSHCLLVCLSFYFLLVCPFSCLSFVHHFFNKCKAKFSENCENYQTALVSSCFTPLNWAWLWRMSNIVLYLHWFLKWIKNVDLCALQVFKISLNKLWQRYVYLHTENEKTSSVWL